MTAEMGEDSITYSFKEVFDRFERDVRDNFANVNRRLDDIDKKTDANTEALANINGRLLVWGAVGLAIGTALSGLVVKYVGS